MCSYKNNLYLNGSLAKHFRICPVEHMKAEPFSLATDGSNDSGLQKMNPLLCVFLISIGAEF